VWQSIASSDSIVILSNVSKIYRMGETEVQALKDVNLEVGRSEFVAVQGPSGSGKTTLLNMIGGLDRPTAGLIHVDGENLVSHSESKLARFRARKVGFIFQFFNLIPTFTVFENVIVPAEILGLNREEMRKRAMQILEKVNLAERLSHFPHQLSGGEQQRVAIARAFMNNPALLLCDEPTGNLDAKTGAEIIHLLSEVNEEQNTTLIVVTHDARIAKESNRIMEIVDGQIVRESQCSSI
jgi:putative ABC transport system ATP-binding protein